MLTNQVVFGDVIDDPEERAGKKNETLKFYTCDSYSCQYKHKIVQMSMGEC
jgi:hypothetical protein